MDPPQWRSPQAGVGAAAQVLDHSWERFSCSGLLTRLLLWSVDIRGRQREGTAGGGAG